MLDQWPKEGSSSTEFPWGALIAARTNIYAGNQGAAIACWREILEHSNLESRELLQAWHFLRQYGEQPPSHVAKQILGVVAELPMPQGFDLVAAYADRSARYWNFSGAGVVWEHPDSSLDSTIDNLLESSKQVVAQIGPWNKGRPGPPPPGQLRLSFLTPSGLHFGQGPASVLSHDPFGARVLQGVVVLMRALMAKAKRS